MSSLSSVRQTGDADPTAGLLTALITAVESKEKGEKAAWHPRESSKLSQSPLHKYFRVAQLFPCLCCRICIGKHSAVGYWSVLGWVTSVVLSTWGPSGELRPKGSDCCDCRGGAFSRAGFPQALLYSPLQDRPSSFVPVLYTESKDTWGSLDCSSKKGCYSFSPRPETLSVRRS